MKISRGDRFEHARMIVGSPNAGTARPDVCTVTRVIVGTIYYRNESGMLMSVATNKLQVKRWLID